MDSSSSVEWLRQVVDRRQTFVKRIWQADAAPSELTAQVNVLDRYLDGSTLDTLQRQSKILKDDRTTTVACLHLKPRQMVLKRYNARSWGHVISRSVRRSRASRCWQMSYAFANAGIRVAAPYLMYEQRFGPLRLNAYFVSEYLPGEELLKALPSMDAEQQSRVLQKIRDAYQRMRAAKLSHGDLKASNLIWHNDELYFIDLDAAQQHRSISSWSRAHHKDRQRFSKNWRDQPALLALFADL